MSRNLLLVPLVLATGLVLADETKQDEPQAPGQEAQAKPVDEAKEISGMSVLGNQDAPKSLVIVPWKTSALGSAVGIAPMLDDSREPVDREVFLRALRYYEIRSELKP